MDKARSIDGVVIRLTEERWFHIVENHNDLAGRYDDILTTVEDPEMILKGYGDALLAVRRLRINRWLVVVYKEYNGDGFVVTAYQTSKLKKEDIIWRKKTLSPSRSTI